MLSHSKSLWPRLGMGLSGSPYSVWVALRVGKGKSPSTSNEERVQISLTSFSWLRNNFYFFGSNVCFWWLFYYYYWICCLIIGAIALLVLNIFSVVWHLFPCWNMPEDGTLASPETRRITPQQNWSGIIIIFGLAWRDILLRFLVPLVPPLSQCQEM